MHTAKLSIARFVGDTEDGSLVFVVKDENEPLKSKQLAQVTLAADKVTDDMRVKLASFTDAFIPSLLPLFEETPHRCKARETFEREKREALEKEMAAQAKEIAEMKAQLAQLLPKPNGASAETPKPAESAPAVAT